MEIIIQIFKGFKFLHLIDILLCGLIFFGFYAYILGRNARKSFNYLLLIVILIWIPATFFRLELLNKTLEVVVQFGVLGLVIIYASDIKTQLTASVNTLLRRYYKNYRNTLTNEDTVLKIIDEVIKAVYIMSRQQVGALIVFKGLDEVEERVSKVKVQMIEPESYIITSIFDKNSPNHDGAMVIDHDKIVALRVVLPVSQDPDLPKNLGLRHLAGVGLTERSDAFVIIVSEETGTVSIACTLLNSAIKRNVQEDELRKFLKMFYNETYSYTLTTTPRKESNL